MFELETLAAFGAGAALMALAPVVRKMGNEELGDSMGKTGRTMAKSGVKVGLVAADVAGKVANGVTKNVAEVAESFVDLVQEAKSERVEPTDIDAEQPPTDASRSQVITEVTVE
ncbi:MAG: hypothetical protein H2062_06795 [Synechococcus sp.]|jgi:hypothetical protein|nr:hypothetical protein [Synechococcus sp.]|tara:strand:- start:936 stop:1277 length:342 start_codon:yes stop_codon:yes gene_type:complete